MEKQNFKFEIGEIVYFRAGINTSVISHNEIPNGFVVVGRIAEECSGGTQLQYVIDGKRIHECELAKISEFDAKEHAQRSIDFEILKDDAKDAAWQARQDAKKARKEKSE